MNAGIHQHRDLEWQYNSTPHSTKVCNLLFLFGNATFI